MLSIWQRRDFNLSQIKVALGAFKAVKAGLERFRDVPADHRKACLLIEINEQRFCRTKIWLAAATRFQEICP
jgi:hypothetical protein